VIAHLRGRMIDGVVTLDEAKLEKITEYRRQYGASQ